MFIHLHMAYGYFLSTVAELKSCNKDCMTHNAYDIYHLALSKDDLPHLW